jgi:hypothetical protein
MSNYIKIEQWMIEELHLSGNELVLFALVAGHKDGYYGSLTYTAEHIGVSRRIVYPLFDKLVAKGYLEEVESDTPTKMYKVGKKLPQGGEKTSPKVGKKLPQSGEKTSLPSYNTNYNLIDNASDNAREENHQKFSDEVKEETDTTPIYENDYKKKKVAPKKKRTADIFTPPTEAEVAAYIAEKGWQVNAAHWHAYYTANGWKVGRSPMKDWRAAVKTWQYNGLTNNKKSSYEQRKFTSGNDAFYGVDTL